MLENSLLKPGERVPHFNLPDQRGEMVDITNLIGKKNLVIYFYPKDFTSGCTLEACRFRDEYETFKEHDAEVIGINSEDSSRHQSFAKSYDLNFILLSDKDRKVEKLFGVKRIFLGLLTGRVSFVVDKQGIVRHVFTSRSQATKHVEEALKVLKSLQ